MHGAKKWQWRRMMPDWHYFPFGADFGADFGLSDQINVPSHKMSVQPIAAWAVPVKGAEESALVGGKR
jgi:hypothetical protein